MGEEDEPNEAVFNSEKFNFLCEDAHKAGHFSVGGEA